MAETIDTKSDKGFFGGLIASKKFGLAGAWTTACLVVVELTIKSSEAITIAALASGTMVVASYVIAQALSEGGVAKVQAARPLKPAVTTTAAAAIPTVTT